MKKGKKKSKKARKADEKLEKSDNDEHIKYLQTWKTNKDNWKFEKVKQMRLVSGMFDCEKVPEDIFPIFIEYMEGSSGNVKNIVIKKATQTVDEMEKWTLLSEEEKEKTDKPDSNKYERARMVLQSLE